MSKQQQGNKKGGNQGGNKKPQEKQSEKAEDRLQAVVLADSFTRELRPITLEKPRSLLPLANIAILDYVMEVLVSSGVQEIFVFCCHGAKQIEQFIQDSHWSKLQNVSVTPISANQAQSAGDALRNIYTMDIIRSDFVLIAGDVISTMNLKPIIDHHKATRKNDPSLLMTSVFKKQRPSKINYLHDRDSVWLALESSTNQLLKFENDKDAKHFNIDLQHFKAFPSVQIRSDLADCHIDICSPDVLEIMNENFDFQDFRIDFLKNYILTEELVTYKVKVHVTSNEYCARVSSLRAYETVSRDVVKRWAFPITLDSNFNGLTSYRFQSPNNYYENNVTFGRTCKLGENSVVGRGTRIGENSTIVNSIIGRNVEIGANVKIVDSFIWDNAKVLDGATITKALVCSGATIGKKAILSRGCVISWNCVIGDGFTVGEHVRITTKKEKDTEYDEDDDDFHSTYSSSPKVSSSPKISHMHAQEVTVEADVGTSGVGAKYAAISLKDKFNLLGIAEHELDIGEPYEEEPHLYNAADDKLSQGSQENHQEQEFWSESQETIRRAISENHSFENAKLEMNGLKFACDASFSDCARAIISGMILQTDDGKRPPMDMMKEFKIILNGTSTRTKWSKLLREFVQDEKSEIDILMFLLDFCKNEGKKFSSLIQYIIQILYDSDLISEDAVLKWADRVKAQKDVRDPADLKLLQHCDKFLQWLKTAEEEEDDDDDDEDDD